MPRKPRLHVPGGLYHVILRGNNRQTIFFDLDDRQRWESLIEVGINRYLHRIHAYCWMPNHVHMAIQSHERPLSGFVRFIASQYSRATNKKMHRTGHLFERRHRAILVQDDLYSKELVRYIHLNPLRARMVGAIADYPWSSHRAYLHGHRPPWLTTNWVLAMFDESLDNARRYYARFLKVECTYSTEKKFSDGSTKDCRVLGDDGFIASLRPAVTALKAPQGLADLVRLVCQKHHISVTQLQSPSRERRYAAIRAEIGLTAVDNEVASNAELARFFNRNQSGMSRAISLLRHKLNK